MSEFMEQNDSEKREISQDPQSGWSYCFAKLVI